MAHRNTTPSAHSRTHCVPPQFSLCLVRLTPPTHHEWLESLLPSFLLPADSRSARTPFSQCPGPSPQAPPPLCSDLWPSCCRHLSDLQPQQQRESAGRVRRSTRQVGMCDCESVLTQFLGLLVCVCGERRGGGGGGGEGGTSRAKDELQSCVCVCACAISFLYTSVSNNTILECLSPLVLVPVLDLVFLVLL